MVDHHEVYVRTEKGLTKADEVRGDRASQVSLRRSVRARMGVGGDTIVLYTNGRFVKAGIDRG